MYCNRELISDLIFVVVILKESSFQCICFNHWNTKTEMPNCWEVIFLVFMDIKDWPQMQRKLSGKRFRDFRELSTCHVHHRHRSAGSGPPANLSTNGSSKMSNDHTRIVTTSTRAQWKIFCPASSPFLKLNIDSRTKVIESHHEMFLFVPKTGDKDLQKFFCTFLNNKILVDFSLYSRQTGGSVTPPEVKSKCQVRLSWRSHVPHILSRACLPVASEEIGRACHVPFLWKLLLSGLKEKIKGKKPPTGAPQRKSILHETDIISFDTSAGSYLGDFDSWLKVTDPHISTNWVGPLLIEGIWHLLICSRALNIEKYRTHAKKIS